MFYRRRKEFDHVGMVVGNRNTVFIWQVQLSRDLLDHLCQLSIPLVFVSWDWYESVTYCLTVGVSTVS